MSPKRTNKTVSKHDRTKILERFEKRYEQVDQQLEQLESKLMDLGIGQDDEASRPTKPR